MKQKANKNMYINKRQMIAGLLMLAGGFALFMSDLPRMDMYDLNAIPWAVSFTLFFFGASMICANMDTRKTKRSPDVYAAFKKSFEVCMIFALLFCLLVLIMISLIPMSSNLTALDVIILAKKCVEVCLGWIASGVIVGFAAVYRRRKAVSQKAFVN